MNIRHLLTMACGLAIFASGTSKLEAQDFVLVVDRDTGVISLSNTDAGNNVVFDYYNITSALGSLSPGAISADPAINAGANDVDAANWTSVQDQSNGNRFLADGWVELGSSTNPPSRFALGEVKQAGFSEIIAGANTLLGPIFDITQAQIDAGFFVDVEDLAVEYGVPTVNGRGEILQGTVSYVGEKIYNNLVLNVDGSGNASIENESQTTVSLAGYTITSDASGLDASFTGLGAGWETAGSSADVLTQTNQLGSLTLAPGATMSIGDITTGSGLTSANLDFDFVLTDVGFDESALDGIVKSDSTAGDFDGDSDVDGFDFLFWQRNPGVGNLADWQNNFGGSPLSGITAVPEPSSLVLLLFGTVSLGLYRNKK